MPDAGIIVAREHDPALPRRELAQMLGERRGANFVASPLTWLSPEALASRDKDRSRTPNQFRFERARSVGVTRNKK